MDILFKKFRTAGFSLVLIIFSSPLYAVPATVLTIGADWTNVQSEFESNVVYIDNDTNAGDEEIRWGRAASDAGQSGYRLEASPTPFNVGMGDIFSLGDFTHTNQPVWDSITGAQLNITTDFEIGSSSFIDEVFSFAFNHNETPNNCDTSPGCANDIVSFSGLASSDTFFVDGVEYTLELVGFSVNGFFMQELSTAENSINTAQLLGSFRAVPAPSAIMLLGLGLIGVALSRKPKSLIS